MNTAAIYDIDGTLLTGFIIQQFPQHLAEKEIIQKTYSNQITEITNNYKKGKITYREAAEKIPNILAQALKGQKQTLIQHEAAKFMKEYTPKTILPYTKKLLHLTKNKLKTNIALSGSPIETIKQLKTLEFDQQYGTEFTTANGHYTGTVKTNLIIGEIKAKTAQQIAKKHKIDLNHSAAFGDSDQDAQTLELVKLPIALNPNPKMKKICNKRKWQTFNTETIDLNLIEKQLEMLTEL